MTREGGYKALFPYVHNKNRPDWKSQGGSKQRKPHRVFFHRLSEKTVALKTTENRLDKENKNAYNITKHVYKKVKPPLLHYYNMVFLQSQGFCSENFSQNRTKANQDNFKIGRLEGCNNFRL